MLNAPPLSIHFSYWDGAALADGTAVSRHVASMIWAGLGSVLSVCRRVCLFPVGRDGVEIESREEIGERGRKGEKEAFGRLYNGMNKTFSTSGHSCTPANPHWSPLMAVTWLDPRDI